MILLSTLARCLKLRQEKSCAEILTIFFVMFFSGGEDPTGIGGNLPRFESARHGCSKDLFRTSR
jgi:hypothetical protein